jgi:glycosyltransferase involved in cell wall biosynthesis
MSHEVFLSIIIPTYKRPEGLNRLLSSIHRQRVDFSQVEVLVVNNSESARLESEEVCNGFKIKGMQIRFIHQSLTGSSFAKNLGIENANGKWLAFLDDDEEIVANYLEVLLPLLHCVERYTVLGGPYFPIFDSKKPRWMKEEYFIISFGNTPRLLSKNEFLLGGNLIVSKSLSDLTGGYLTNYGHKGNRSGYGEDTEYISRALKKGAIQSYYPSLAIYHHIPVGRMKLEWFKQQKKLSSLAKARVYLLSNPVPRNYFARLKMRIYYLKTAITYLCQMVLLICAGPFRNQDVFRFHENYWIEKISPVYARYRINVELYKLINEDY